MQEEESNNHPLTQEELEEKRRRQRTVPTLRTFRADVEDLIIKRKATRASVALAEADRREARGEARFPTEDENPQLGKIIFLLLLLLAFCLGVGGYALFGSGVDSFFGNTAGDQPTPTTDDIAVDLTASPHEQVLADISIAFGKTYLPTGGRRAIVYYIKDGEGKRRATETEFFTAVSDAPVPQSFSASLVPNFDYQVYSSSTLSGAITLRTRSYASTFATMLEWEPEMARALIPALNSWYPRKTVKELGGRKFKDEQIGGVSARTLTDLDGNSVLAYAFPDKQTLIIAGTVDALRSLIENPVKIK